MNPLADAVWQGRAARLHAFWARHLFERDADITPMMLCGSLLPGAWQRGYPKLLRLAAEA